MKTHEYTATVYGETLKVHAVLSVPGEIEPGDGFRCYRIIGKQLELTDGTIRTYPNGTEFNLKPAEQNINVVCNAADLDVDGLVKKLLERGLAPA
jgi:hypothetical protein